MKPFRGFPRQEPWRISNMTIIITCMFLLLCVLSLVKPRYCPAPNVKLIRTPVAGLKVAAKAAAETEQDEFLQPDDEEDNTSTATKPVKIKKPICDVGERSDTCDAEGDVRVQPTSGTVFIHNPTQPQQQLQEWKVRPYARKDPMVQSHVRQWNLKQTPSNDNNLPACAINHTDPAVVFSTGGFSGNYFHDFTDILIPLFISTRQFGGKVHLLTSDTKSWWPQKYRLILSQLSRHEIIDADSDDVGAGVQGARCFPRVILGPEFHKELGIDPDLMTGSRDSRFSMAEFRRMLMKAFGLKRETIGATNNQAAPGIRPRLLIIGRKKSRAFLNQRAMQAVADTLGYEVIVREPDISTDFAKFARLVNSADVLLGVHGAGLTNMVFLPAGAVVIQIVPLGKLEYIARNSFKDPAPGMGVKYLEYMITPEESTLVDKYPKDHPVIVDPMTAVHSKGWEAIKDVYLDHQNVRVNLGRLRDTLKEALKMLPRDQ